MGLDEQEAGHFKDLKEKFVSNQKTIKQLRERLLELAGGRECAGKREG